jgi:hypothetical protein
VTQIVERELTWKRGWGGKQQNSPELTLADSALFKRATATQLSEQM